MVISTTSLMVRGELLAKTGKNYFNQLSSGYLFHKFRSRFVLNYIINWIGGFFLQHFFKFPLKIFKLFPKTPKNAAVIAAIANEGVLWDKIIYLRCC